MQRTKYIYLAIIILCLIIIGFSTYYSLGGFDPVEVYVMEGKERTVIGKEYIESVRKSKLKARVEEAKAVVDSGQLKGKLTVVYFKNDTVGADFIHYFVGASVDEIKDVIRLPAGYSYREFTTDKIFKVFITQHWLVGPNPQEMDEIIEVKAIEEGEVLQPLSFDLYYSDDSWSTERWAR